MSTDDIRAQYEAAIMSGLAVRVLRTSNQEIAAAILGHLEDAGLLPDGIETSLEQSLWRWKHAWQEAE